MYHCNTAEKTWRECFSALQRMNLQSYVADMLAPEGVCSQARGRSQRYDACSNWQFIAQVLYAGVCWHQYTQYVRLATHPTTLVLPVTHQNHTSVTSRLKPAYHSNHLGMRWRAAAVGRVHRDGNSKVDYKHCWVDSGAAAHRAHASDNTHKVHPCR
jgi:hypothetical protein